MISMIVMAFASLSRIGGGKLNELTHFAIRRKESVGDEGFRT